MPSSSMLLKTVKMAFFTGGRKKSKAHSVWQNPRGEEITVKETHSILPGGQKSLLQKRDRQKKSSTPVCPSTKCTEWMLKKKGTRGPSRCPAASTGTLSLQTITLLSIDQTKETSAYCVHSCVNDEETKSLSPDMKEKFREHQKRRKESSAEKVGDKKEPK